MAEFYGMATRKLGTPPMEARSLLEGLRAVLAVRVVDERDLEGGTWLLVLGRAALGDL
jgi:hypothetical protein